MRRAWAVAALFCTSFASAVAAPIYYETQWLGGSNWQYNYTLGNEVLESPIYEFTVWFDLGVYENLSLATAPTEWDPLAIQPDVNLPDDGFFDALALADGLDVGGLLSGFSVRFEYLGAGTPGSQRFDIVDPLTFEALFSGVTIARSSEPPIGVPETGSLILMLTGLAGILGRRRRDDRSLAAKPSC
jgi:hypothetical protein